MPRTPDLPDLPGKPPAAPALSIVIPVFNEAAIIETAVLALLDRAATLGPGLELLLCENGSRDETPALVDALAERDERVRALHCPAPDYGLALKLGIEAARGRFVICDEIDLGDLDFYRRALELLAGGADLVVGSKRHPQAQDRRPWLRRQGTLVINGLLRLSLGFHGTDTHGLKAFDRQALAPIVADCVLTRNLFASELVIRAERAGLRVVEIPLTLREIRPPSVGLLRRVPRVLQDLAQLVYILRLKG